MWYLINSWKTTFRKFSPWKNPLPLFTHFPVQKIKMSKSPFLPTLKMSEPPTPAPMQKGVGEGTITGIAESNNIQWGVHWVLFNQTYQKMGKFSVSAHVEKVKKLYAAWISCICQEQPPRGVHSKSYSENMP